MLAVALGSAAALELGDGKKALAFFQSVLKYDPDQASIRTQYKKLKEVLKLTDEAETQLTKGYNHKAVKALDEVRGRGRGRVRVRVRARRSRLGTRCSASSTFPPLGHFVA